MGSNRQLQVLSEGGLMGHRIRRSDFLDYASYLDAIGGADSRIVWDEDDGN